MFSVLRLHFTSTSDRSITKLCIQKLDLLLLYDFQNIHSDEIHHRFHFIVTSMIIHWNQHIGVHRPVLLQLLSFLQRDDLSKVQIESVTRERIYDNLNNCLHANFLPNSYEINLITTLKNSLIQGHSNMVQQSSNAEKIKIKQNIFP